MALDTGIPAPDFTLKNTRGKDVRLSSFKGDRHVVLLFFPLAFTSTCTEELCTTRDNMKQYESLDAEVLAVSADSFFVLNEYKKANNLNFTLLSDYNREVSRMYDALYELYYDMKEVPKRAAYVIDKNGIIRYSEVLEDSGKLPDFEAVNRVLREEMS